MKTYNKRITPAAVDKILDFCRENDIYFEILEGVLLDSYLIHNMRKMRIGNIQARNYVIIRETYQTQNSSVYTLICTDNETLVEDFQLQLEAQIEYELFCQK